jgi:nitroimidazol reductase NimA-like FMN-containing flavoprotein (pyridoxamine 5'-phosphate oxidase superfamily)
VPELVEIAENECLELLAAHSVGRIAVVHDGRPLIFPVNYVLDGRTVAFRTDAGTKFDWAVMGPVAFEVDWTDPMYHEGWSVMVQGIGRDITGGLDAQSQRVTAHTLTPWAGGAKDHWVAIASPVISGRRILQHLQAEKPSG